MFDINSRSERPLKEFFNNYSTIIYKKGEKIVRPSESEANASYVESGFLKIYHVSKNGKEVIINIINATQYTSLIFGWATYIKDYSIEALTDVQVIRVPKNAFLKYINEHPHAYAELLQPLSRCLKSTYSQIKWLKSGNSSFKIASVLYYLAKETTEDDIDRITIGFRVTHQMIANLTGLTRETVTVQLNKLREKGFIEYDDNVLTVTSMSKLSQLLEIEK